MILQANERNILMNNSTIVKVLNNVGYIEEDILKGLNERQRKAVKFIAEKGKITNKEYQKLTNSIKKTATRDLNELVLKKVLKRVGTTGKGTYYIIGDIKGTFIDAQNRTINRTITGRDRSQ